MIDKRVFWRPLAILGALALSLPGSAVAHATEGATDTPLFSTRPRPLARDNFVQRSRTNSRRSPDIPLRETPLAAARKRFTRSRSTETNTPSTLLKRSVFPTRKSPTR